MAVQVTWIHHASFRLQGPEGVCYIDPWKIETEPHDADVVFVSHSHFDHCSPDDIIKLTKLETTVIAPTETIERLNTASAVSVDERVTVRDITVETVAAYNTDKAFHPRDNNWCGAVITLGGKRIYYAGDTDLIPEMNDLAEVDLAMLPVGGKYTMDAEAAARACEAIGCSQAIPYHWGDIIGGQKDAEDFAAKACCKVHVLQPGESVEV